MTEENKFIKVDSIPIYDDGIGYVQLWDASHANESEEQRIYTVTTIASLAYGNESAKNPEALYERMKSIKHESLWEFIRIGEFRTDWDGNRGKFYSSIEHSMRNLPHIYSKKHRKSDAELHKQNIACFRIKVPIFVARQFMRHRSFSYLEMSRRYTKDSKVPFEFWFPKGFNEEHKALCVKDWDTDYERISSNYHTQVASRFLPQTTYTEFYCMAEWEGLKNFMNLRLDEHAQEEIRIVAQAMADLLKQHQPELYKKVIP